MIYLETHEHTAPKGLKTPWMRWIHWWGYRPETLQLLPTWGAKIGAAWIEVKQTRMGAPVQATCVSLASLSHRTYDEIQRFRRELACFVACLSLCHPLGTGWQDTSAAPEDAPGWITPRGQSAVLHCMIPMAACLDSSQLTGTLSAWAGLIMESEQLLRSAFIYAQRHSQKVHLFPQYQEIISLVSKTEPFWSASDRMSQGKCFAACSKVQSVLLSRHDFLCFPPSGFPSYNQLCRLGQFAHCWSPLDKYSAFSFQPIYFTSF